MAYVMKLESAMRKIAAALQAGDLIGQGERGARHCLASSLYRASDGATSALGAALPSRLVDWIHGQGLQGLRIAALARAGHVEFSEPGAALHFEAIETLDLQRIALDPASMFAANSLDALRALVWLDVNDAARLECWQGAKGAGPLYLTRKGVAIA